MELGQAVDGDVEEVGPRVLEAVPARVVGRVAQPEVGPEVDDRGAGGDELRDDASRRRRGAGPGRPRRAAGSRGVDDVRPVVAEVRVDAVDRVVVAVAARRARRSRRSGGAPAGGPARRRHSPVAPMIPTRIRARATSLRRRRVASAARTLTGGPPRPRRSTRAPRSRAQHQAPHGEHGSKGSPRTGWTAVMVG